ncbi:MAG: type II toxin-antitoxin system HicA family toxin [Ignavibacteriae bacterium]|nr:type II toxin-antitoxin system HicA family toxin [Ignavibacteriota bacterium]
MRQLSGKELASILEHHGWELLRVHGSHHIFGKTGSKFRISIPIHGNTPLKKGLQRHLLALAGLKESDI